MVKSKQYKKRGVDKKSLALTIIAGALLVSFLWFFFADASSNITGNVITGEVAKIDSVVNFVDAAIGGLTKILGPLVNTTSDFLLPKIAFLIGIFIIVWVILYKIEYFEDHGGARFILGIVVAVLATRWLADENVLKAVLLPYNAFGAALSALIPFIGGFWFLNITLKDEKWAPIRKLGWILIALFFGAYWISTEAGNFEWIYFLAACLSLLLTFLDGTIQRYWRAQELKRFGRTKKEEIVTDYKQKIAEVQQMISDGSMDPAMGAKKIREFQKIALKFTK